MNMKMFDDVCLCFSCKNESILKMLGRGGAINSHRQRMCN